MKNLVVLLTLTAALASPSFAQNSNVELGAKNSAARAEALARIGSDDGSGERAHVELMLGKFKAMGVEVGPLCFQLTHGCLTQADLGYRSSEYYSLGELKDLPKAGLYTSIFEIRFHGSEEHAKFRRLAEENGVEELVLVQALEAKEKLELAYLESYTKTHPNSRNRYENNASYLYSWKISAAGEVYEEVAVLGSSN